MGLSFPPMGTSLPPGPIHLIVGDMKIFSTALGSQERLLASPQPTSVDKSREVTTTDGAWDGSAARK